MKKIILSIILLNMLVIFSMMDAYGQNVVRGRITEKDTKEPLIGATVVELDANDRIVKGAIADVNGNYVINVSSSNARLQFSFIGFTNTTIEVKGRSVIDIELAATTFQFGEVVVTATRETDHLTGQNIRDRTVAATRIDMTELRNVGGLSVDEVLQGQISGLDIVSGGAPGGASSIVIRGLGSLGDAQPLIVVNGIAQDIKTDFSFEGADQEDIGALLSIAPQDIKSIDLLKDAAATAIWGSRGANGVLLIETERGARGKTLFNYNYRFTLTQQPDPIPMLNGDEYITLQLEQYHNALGLFVTPPEIAYDPEYTDFFNYSANTNWLDEITRIGMNHEHFFKFSGGGDKTAFYASLNATQQDGTTLNEAFKRLSTRINLDYDLSRKIKFSVNFTYNNSYRNGNLSLGGRNVRQMAYIKAPNMSIMEHDEFGNLTGEFFNPINSYQGSGISYFNPVAIASQSKSDAQNNTFENSYVFNYAINKWMRLTETISFQYGNVKNIGFLPHTAIGVDWLHNSNNESNERNANNRSMSSRTQLFFTPLVTPVHSLQGSIMTEIRQSQAEWSQVVSSKGSSVIIIDPGVGAHVSRIQSNYSELRSFGTLVNLFYKYRDKYLINANLRADASSSFGRNNRWGLFPSISAGWRFSNENWFSSWDFLNEGMLRAGYGKAGTEPGNPYSRFGTFVNTDPSLYIFNSATIPSQTNLVNLKWQTVESYNLGLDLTLLNNRLTVQGEFYDKLTSDLLHQRYRIPTSSGFNVLPWYNGGEIRNYGWEASVRYNFLRRPGLSATVNFNIARNTNKFLKFPDNFQNIVGTSIGNGVYPRMAQVGQPVGSFYGFRYQGVYSTSGEAYARNADGSFKLDANGNRIPMRYVSGYQFAGGDAMYEDINNDGIIDLGDVVYLGDSNPRYVGGFGLNANYKQFRFSTQFIYRTGFDIVNMIALNTEGAHDRNNKSKAVLKRWRNEGDDYPGILPRAYLNNPANNLGSDRYVEKGDFIRLNNLTASYSFKRSAIQRIGIDDLELGLNLKKVWTLTNYTGQDPEIGQRMTDPFWFGQDNGMSPNPNVYSMFINIRF